jgi:hypothetical protein
MKETFVEKKFNPASLKTIKTVNEILDEYAAQGYDLSLRQLYYQLVARGFIENSIQSYKRVGSLVSDARLAGMIDWNMISDRGRVRVTPSHWVDPSHILRSAAHSFRINKWENQEYFVMCMVEKQALEGVLIPVCESLDIPFIANKGYSSSSSMYEIGKDLKEMISAGKEIVILYLGDHDPSGIDMTRDVLDRLNMFAGYEDFKAVEVDRLALNYSQVEELNPPPNPAKETDARFEGYVEKFGDTCWELDAIEPAQLAQIVTDAVGGYRDFSQWEADVEREADMRAELERMAQQYRRNGGNQE